MKHILFTLTGCNSSLIDDEDYVRSVPFESCKVAGATWLKTCSHKFDPQGVTGAALLAESHLSIHTWPEKQTAVCDIFSCSDATKASDVLFMQEKFEASGSRAKPMSSAPWTPGLVVLAAR